DVLRHEAVGEHPPCSCVAIIGKQCAASLRAVGAEEAVREQYRTSHPVNRTAVAVRDVAEEDPARHNETVRVVQVRVDGSAARAAIPFEAVVRELETRRWQPQQ